MFLRFIFILPLAPFLCLAENHRGPASSWSHSAASYVPASESQFGGGEAEDTCYIWVNRQRWRDASLWALSAEQPRLLKQNFNDEWLVTTWKCCCCGYWLASCEGWLLSGAAFSRLPLQRSAISMNKKKKKASAAFAYGDLGMMCMWGLLSWTLWHYEEVWRVKGSNTHMFMKTALQPCPTCHCVCVCLAIRLWHQVGVGTTAWGLQADSHDCQRKPFCLTCAPLWRTVQYIHVHVHMDGYQPLFMVEVSSQCASISSNNETNVMVVLSHAWLLYGLHLH